MMIIDIVKHALTISVVKIDIWNHQQNRRREKGFVDFRCDYCMREAASVDFHTDFSCDFGYENRHCGTRPWGLRTWNTDINESTVFRSILSWKDVLNFAAIENPYRNNNSSSYFTNFSENFGYHLSQKERKKSKSVTFQHCVAAPPVNRPQLNYLSHQCSCVYQKWFLRFQWFFQADW